MFSSPFSSLCLSPVVDIHSGLLPTPSSPGDEPALWCSKQNGGGGGGGGVGGCDRPALVEKVQALQGPYYPARGHGDGAGLPTAEPRCPVPLSASQNFALSYDNQMEEE